MDAISVDQAAIQAVVMSRVACQTYHYQGRVFQSDKKAAQPQLYTVHVKARCYMLLLQYHQFFKILTASFKDHTANNRSYRDIRDMIPAIRDGSVDCVTAKDPFFYNYL